MTSIWEKKGTPENQIWETGTLPYPVYDMHGHMGKHPAIYFNRSEAPDIVAHLKRAGVKHLAFSHHYALDGFMRNSEVVDICKQFPDALRMYVAINPNFPENTKEDLAQFDKWAPYAIGLKFLGDYHGYPYTDKRFEYAAAFANERKIPLLCHTWGTSRCNGGPVMYEMVQRYPQAKFFLGHSIFGEWDYAERCVKESAGNVWLELTAIPGTRGLIEDLVRRVGSTRILYGTDMPWFDEFQGIGGVLSAKISDEDKKNILCNNPESILGKDW